MHWLIIILGILVAYTTAKAQSYSFKSEIYGNGKPVIFIPGLSCDGDVWKETVKQISNTYECHVLTLPGFNDQPPADFQNNYLKSIGDEIQNYIDTKNLDNVILVGHSLGGFLSLLIAIDNQSNIEKIVIVDAVPFFAALQNPFATEEQMKEMAPNFKISEMKSDEFKKRQYQILRSMISDSSKIELAMKWSLNSDLDAINQSMYDLYTTDLRDDINGLSIPTLVFGSWIAYKDYGVTKEMVENNFKSQFKGLTNFTLLMSENGRHFIMWDDREWFIEQMSSFLEEKS